MLVRILWVPPQERELKPGEVYDLPGEVAQRLVDLGEAEFVEPEPAKRGRKAG